jgi:rRNA maturation protein Nop10
MAPAYRECPSCGKRALSIATRCPQCGEELPTQPIRWEISRDRPALRRRSGRRLPVPALLAALLVAGGLAALALRDRGTRAVAPVPAPDAAPAALETARAAASPVLPDSVPSLDAVRRYARTWTNVHDRRSPQADVVAVLLPGDTVLADSLHRGWWRVALEGRVVGYVYERTLVDRPVTP